MMAGINYSWMRATAIARRSWVLPSAALAIVLDLCTSPADSAQWYTINERRGECERANRTDYPSPDDYVDYLQKQNQYRSRDVSRDFAGRPEAVTVTDTSNHQMTFYADDDSCQQALRRQHRVGGSRQVR
jgi:hypothetical protein